MDTISLFYLVLFATLSIFQLKQAAAKNLGVCYGRLATDLPPPEDVARLFDRYQFGRMRIYAPDHRVFRALQGSNVQLTVGIPNQGLYAISAELVYADDWFIQNIEPHVGQVKFRYIVVGHDDVINENSAKDVFRAITNLHAVLISRNLQNQIKITTEVNWHVLRDYQFLPDAEGTFQNRSISGIYMAPIVKFLAYHDSPLFVMNYPHKYYTYGRLDIKSNTKSSNFAAYSPLFLFDAVIDVFHSALEKVGGANVRVVVGETGWPSDSEDRIGSMENAKNYVWGLADHVLSNEGTPLRPNIGQIETYVYNLFNENLRDGEWKNFGLFNANMTPIYGIPPLK